MAEYKIKEVKEGNDTQTADTIIDKSDFSVDFSLNDFIKEKKQLVKLITELSAQQNLELAKIDNINRYHPEVKEISPELLVAINLYQQANVIVATCAEKLDEFKKQLADWEIEREAMEEQLGIKIDRSGVEKLGETNNDQD